MAALGGQSGSSSIVILEYGQESRLIPDVGDIGIVKIV